MNAKLQRWQLFIRLSAALGIMFLVWRSEGWSFAFGLSILVLWFHAPFVLLSFLTLRWVNRRESPRLGDLLNAWLSELVALDFVFAWQQPFSSARWADRLDMKVPGYRPALLLHGYTCNRGLWNTWMRAFGKLGVPFKALTLEPAFGSIDDYVEAIESAMRELESQHSGQSPVLIAHSMGGLAARAWLRRYGKPGRVARIVTLGTPHQGTLLARWGLGRNASEMRPGNAWLAELADSESNAQRAEFECYFSRCDQIVCPAGTARLPGARAIEVTGVGHLGLVFHPLVQQGVLELLTLAPQESAEPKKKP